MTEPTAGDTAPERTSQALRRVLNAESGPRVTVGSLFHNMGERAHSVLLILFALPNTLPGIPGTSAVMGVPLLYLTLQMALGRDPWLPGFITNRSLARETLATLMERGIPWIERGESYLHPRLTALASPRAERLIGILSVFLALSIMLPIPFGNMLPALAIILFALGLMEDDGAWVLGGLVTAIAALALVVFVLWALIKSAIFVLLGAFGWG
ncbi:exopolysaccharide biosynthesis protein [Fuscibacter oryzae]|uniref:Exopolysaccharide biosynthesis protein n=1 Tax=Fuscibacter oryzae TaxID=2803939 RepID=A0A8J7MTB9_9RHOB|nr:exopolysaccharide biosynthesis protein [Fuscibacter oryzae]MBL4928028.1 exopolysaccharide biosynthesis protein [Fuscibacter oryzae]